MDGVHALLGLDEGEVPFDRPDYDPGDSVAVLQAPGIIYGKVVEDTGDVLLIEGRDYRGIRMLYAARWYPDEGVLVMADLVTAEGEIKADLLARLDQRHQ